MSLSDNTQQTTAQSKLYHAQIESAWEFGYQPQRTMTTGSSNSDVWRGNFIVASTSNPLAQKISDWETLVLGQFSSTMFLQRQKHFQNVEEVRYAKQILRLTFSILNVVLSASGWGELSFQKKKCFARLDADSTTTSGNIPLLGSSHGKGRVLCQSVWMRRVVCVRVQHESLVWTDSWPECTAIPPLSPCGFSLWVTQRSRRFCVTDKGVSAWPPWARTRRRSFRRDPPPGLESKICVLQNVDSFWSFLPSFKRQFYWVVALETPPTNFVL